MTLDSPPGAPPPRGASAAPAAERRAAERGRSSASRARRRWLKLGVGGAALAPAALITFRFLSGELGANPIVEAMNQVGTWTLVTLLATLACTPLKILFGWSWPLAVRRLLGLVAFFYVCLHFSIYLLLDQGLAWGEIWEDIWKRKFITAGFLGFLLLVPLALTSTNKMVKRLGFPRWKRLHRLVYLAALAGVIHYLWRVKADTREPLIYGGVLLLLLAVRLYPWWQGWRPRAGG